MWLNGRDLGSGRLPFRCGIIEAMRWVALVLLLTGCDEVLGLKRNEVRDGGIDAPVDGPPIDALITCGGTVLLREDFPTKGEMATNFDPYDGENGSRIDVVAAQLVVTTGVQTGYAIITSNKVRDFTGGIAQVRIVAAAEPLYAETFFDLRHATAMTRHFFSIGHGMIQMGVLGADGMTVTQEEYANYDAATNVFFRFEHRGTLIAYLTSADGMTWPERHVATLGFDLTQSVVRLGAGSYLMGSTVYRTATFDEFEQCRQ